MDDKDRYRIDSLAKLDTWNVVDGSQVHPDNILSTAWVFKIKENENGEVIKCKARLVVKGYEQLKGIDFTDTFSPVARLTSIRVLISLTAQQ